MGPQEEVSRKPAQLRVLVVDNANDPPPPQFNSAAGDRIVSKQRMKRFQEKQRQSERTMLTVCRWCWRDGHGKHRDLAVHGTMKKDKITGLYEHLEYCAGKRDRDDKIIGGENVQD